MSILPGKKGKAGPPQILSGRKSRGGKGKGLRILSGKPARRGRGKRR
jgi:hypothetical protein